MKNISIKLILFILFIGCSGNSKEEVFYDNGKIKLSVDIEDGKRNGVLTKYNEDGNLITKQEWKDGKPHGKSIYYYENGEVEQIVNWNFGKYEGEYFTNYPNGKLRSKGNYIEGNKVGNQYYYYENGQVERIVELNEFGKMVNYYDYDSLGNKNIYTRAAVFLPVKDTIKLGETYNVEIRLGNQLYDSISVDIGDEFIQNGTDLKNIIKTIECGEEGICTYSVKPNIAGNNKILGFINDIKQVNGNEDYDVLVESIPFEHLFYVKE